MNTERELIELCEKITGITIHDAEVRDGSNRVFRAFKAGYEAAPSTAALQKRIEELEADQPLPEQFYLNYIRTLQSALKRLSFAAQTSGGTAGKDDELMAAIEQAGEALKFKTAAQAYGDAQAAKEG